MQPIGSGDYLMKDNVTELSRLESELLQYLASHIGRAVSRDELLQQVWCLNPQFTQTRTVDMHVANLRRKLGARPEPRPILQTVRGLGYQLA